MDIVLDRRLQWLALLAFALSFVFPIHGLGVDLCPIHRATGYSCPGCGLSRGVSAVTQGSWQTALELHAFSPVVWLFLLGLAALAVSPRKIRERAVAQLQGLAPWPDRILGSLLVLMFLFGLVRFAQELFASV